MLYALDDKGKKIRATPEAQAICPECLAPVIAKCGVINIWHWAHRRRANCDIWGEHETKWHLDWKSRFPAECVEVLIERDGSRHRADIYTPRGLVIELQHSALSPEEIAEREAFYRNMLWVFDVSEPYDEDRLDFRNKGQYHTFRWKMPRKHISCVRQGTAHLDTGDGRLFKMMAIHIESPCGGWGYFGRRDDFIRQHSRQ